MCRIAFVGKNRQNGILAQLGEHLPYKQRVIGSSPIGSIFYGEVAQLARARGSYPRCREFESPPRYADVAQSVERRLGKAEVTSSILVISSERSGENLIFFCALKPFKSCLNRQKII